MTTALKPPLHPRTADALAQLANASATGVLITGPLGAGVTAAADHYLDLLTFAEPRPEVIELQTDNPSLAIDDVRHLSARLKHRAGPDHRRIVIIRDAHKLTTEAQNSLLKPLEEPGLNTQFILVTNQAELLLPTIHSRLQTVVVHDPRLEDLKDYFRDVPEQQLERLIKATGGKFELIEGLLRESNGDKSLVAAVDQAKQLLKAKPFERLVQLGKAEPDRAAALELCDALQVVLASLLRLKTHSQPDELKRLLEQIELVGQTRTGLVANGNVKLILTQLAVAL